MEVLCIGVEEITKNDFNLNISRYISSAVGEKKISLEETNAESVLPVVCQSL